MYEKPKIEVFGTFREITKVRMPEAGTASLYLPWDLHLSAGYNLGGGQTTS